MPVWAAVIHFKKTWKRQHDQSAAGWQFRKQLLARAFGLPLGQALDILDGELNPDSELHSEYIQHRSRYMEVVREERAQTITREAKDLAYNRIRVALQSLTSEMKADDFHPDLNLEVIPTWAHRLKGHDDTIAGIPRKYLIAALTVLIALFLGGIWYLNHLADVSEEAPQTPFFGTLTDSQNRLVESAIIQIGQHTIQVENGRFDGQLPLSADSIVPIQIFVDDSLIYEKRNSLHSPFDRKLPYP